MKLVNHYTSLHDLIADTSGNAMILESGEDNNLITEIGGNKFNVMTNFWNSNFAGENYTSVTGTGSDRYITAYECSKRSMINHS